ncbi:MAG TPA: 16S rRNA (cytosine(967)-C(5))-methyltransferase RsmB [Candidatus Acidoferrales bacterium]|nr:16S rRNA (cytosine(967)-C(5))-methyltransferase RsmB [Candidatus Acidoferrales bacterium]
MAISPARKIAYSILLRVETQRAYASDLLHSRVDADVTARDAALTTELVLGVLRRQNLLDFFIERYTGKKFARLDAEILIALRLGIYQLRFLSRVPARAAVNESAEIVKRTSKKSAVALVNAVLRRAAEEKDRPAEELIPAGLPPVESLSILFSHPAWLVERWLRQFGETKTRALLAINNQPPKQACAITDSIEREELLHSLKETGIEFAPGKLLRDAIILNRGNLLGTRAFQEGKVAIQDEASQLIPSLLHVSPGNSVLDLCAAPGGKTIALGRAAGRTAMIVASDLHEKRLGQMAERLKKASPVNVKLVALDGTTSLPFGRKFDRILVDAPCSGTGTLARNPEIRWRLTPEGMAELRRQQVALLSSALECLSPDGELVYSTCSLEAEENDEVVREILRAHPDFTMSPIEIPDNALASGVAVDDLVGADGAFRTFPPHAHTDGFFAVRLRRR